MATIIRLNKGENYNKGYINLYGATGKRYRSLALDIPGYGMVPCSMKLCRDFTTCSDDLMIVLSDHDDPNAPITSDIWVTRKKQKQAC